MRTRLSRQRGFTIIELMIVVAIMIALVAILVPTLAHAKRIAQKAAAQAQLGALQNSLGQYYAVFHVYPSSSTPSYGGVIAVGRGGAMLAEGLVGYLDGNLDGAGFAVGDLGNNGFRLNKNAASMGGTVYGPYAQLDVKGFKALSPTDQYFIDPWGHEILYYRSSQSPPNTPTGAANVFGTANALFNSIDCSVNPVGYGPNPNPAAGAAAFFNLLGAQSNSPGAPSTKGADSFLLVSAGPDGIYFTGDDIVAGKQ